MAVQSIRAPVQKGDMAGDHFFGATVKMPLGKMNRVGEIDDLAQEIRAGAEAFNDAGNLLPSGTGAPVIVGCCRVTGRLGIFGDFDLRLRLDVVGSHRF